MNTTETSSRGGVLPMPLMSGLLLAVWLLANNSASLGHLVLGSMLALAIPLVTQSFWPDYPRVKRPGVVIKLILVFLYDVLVANFAVARLVVAPNRGLRPQFVEVPVELTDANAVATLAAMITLTPGTVSTHFNEADRKLSVHVLDCDNPAEIISTIKQRYESPLREIFE